MSHRSWWVRYDDPEPPDAANALGNSGWLCGDTPSTAVRCPRCAGAVIYNGNYFCRRWRRGCDWALGDDPLDVDDRRVRRWLNAVWREHHDAELGL